MFKAAVITIGLIVLGVALSGCTSAGPFVTSISSDGRGGIIIEKDTVYLNGFTGTISNGGRPTTQNIKLYDK